MSKLGTSFELNVNFYLNSSQLQLQCLDLNLIDYYSVWL